MLIEELERDIFALDGRRIEYKDLIKNLEKYFYFPQKYAKIIEERKKMTPQQFFYVGTQISLPNDCTCLFYHIPFREATKAEIKVNEKYSDEEYSKQMLLYVSTFDNINTLYICPFFPAHATCEESGFYCDIFTGRKKLLIDIEDKLFALGGKKIEYVEIQKEIDQYVYYLQDEPRYDIYCHNAIDRLKSMTKHEFIYYLTNKSFYTDCKYTFYHIPYKEEFKNTSKEFLEKNVYQLKELDSSLVSVKEILIILGTYDDKHMEYLMPIFPFDMLEEKQKEIKEFIFSNKQ